MSKGDDQSTAAQSRALETAGCKRVFEEAASGGRWDRPKLLEIIGQLREGDVVVWKLDRLSRSLKDLLHILERIEGAGAGFRSLTEAIDTTTAAGRMMMQMIGSFAEFERIASSPSRAESGQTGTVPAAPIHRRSDTPPWDARAIADALAAREVRLQLGSSLHDPYNSTGQMFFNILATFGEFEADLIRLPTREGMALARARGKLKGKQPKLKERQARERPVLGCIVFDPSAGD